MLKGSVLDEDGMEIPGVLVTIASDQLIGGAQSRQVNDDGSYRFSALPPGSYVVKAEKEKFRTVEVTGVQIQVNRTTVQPITMKLASSEGEIDVIGTAEKVVDVDNVSRGQVLSKDFLRRIPAGRSYQSAVQFAAGVVGGSNPNMGGGSYNENTYMLDGANITDPVTGTFSLNFNYDAIQQIEVLLGGYMPEYGVSLGGVINLVTQSGTNNLEFDTSVFYQNGNWRGRMDSRFTADGFQLAPTGFDSEFQLMTIAGRISGPLIRDRAWFIISYQHSRSLIANTGIPQPRDYDGHYVLAKLTVQPNSEHRFTTFLQLDPSSIDNQAQGNPFVKPEAQQRQYQGGYVTQLRWQWFLSPEANLDTQVVVQKSFIEVGSVPCTHNRSLGYHPCKATEREGDVDWETPARLGSFGAYDSVNYGYFYFDDRLRYQASTKLSLLGIEDPLGGTHDLKFGVEGVQTVWDQIQGYSGSTLFVDLNEVSYDPQTFKNYYWQEITGPIKFRTSASQWNFFVQDAWKPFSNLVVKGGVRYDNTVMRNDVGEPVVSVGMWGPRLYASWDPWGDQKTKIAGGYGRFNDTSRLAVASFTSAASYGSKLFLGEFFDSGDQGFLNSSNLMYSYGPRENQNLSHDKIRSPRVDELSVIIQREIIEDIGIETNMAYKMTRFLYEFDEQNVVYDEDGSAVIGSRYSEPFNNIYRLRTPALAKRDYVQWDLAIYKVLSRRWFGRLTYTYTRSVGNSSSALSGSFANAPQTQYNYGPFLATDLRHVVKGYASWELPTDPWQQTLSATFEYYSGQPLERRYYSEEGMGYNLRIRPRGVYARFPSQWSVGVKFMQDIDVRRGKIQLSAEATNVFNNRAPDNFFATFYRENRLFSASRQSPLQIQLGARYEF
jgi:hypothetical protein